MLAANHGQNRLRGDPFRSSSLMTLIPLVSRPSGPLLRCGSHPVLPSSPALGWDIRQPGQLALGNVFHLSSHRQQRDRARGALYGLAIGDALGMPTQLLSRRQITERWGPLLTGFEPAPARAPDRGRDAGRRRHRRHRAGRPARPPAAVRPGRPRASSRTALVAWERDMAARGSLDLLGPSTRRAVEAVLAGTPPEEAGTSGDTNGAAMRIAPVGIATARRTTCRRWSTRCTRRASSRTTRRWRWPAPPPWPPRSAPGVERRRRPTRRGGDRRRRSPPPGSARERGHWVGGRRRRRPHRAGPPAWSPARPAEEAAEVIYSLVGTSLATQESVPAAFAVLSAVPGDPWRACLLAASLGGDCDTIAAMAGAIGGACHGLAAFPPHAAAVIDAHGLGLRRPGRLAPGAAP